MCSFKTAMDSDLDFVELIHMGSNGAPNRPLLQWVTNNEGVGQASTMVEQQRGTNNRIASHSSECVAMGHQQGCSESYNRNNGGKRAQKALWEDDMVDSFLEICVDLANDGRKPGNHLDAKGYEILEKKFHERTGVH